MLRLLMVLDLKVKIKHADMSGNQALNTVISRILRDDISERDT